MRRREPLWWTGLMLGSWALLLISLGWVASTCAHETLAGRWHVQGELRAENAHAAPTLIFSCHLVLDAEGFVLQPVDHFAPHEHEPFVDVPWCETDNPFPVRTVQQGFDRGEPWYLVSGQVVDLGAGRIRGRLERDRDAGFVEFFGVRPIGDHEFGALLEGEDGVGHRVTGWIRVTQHP